MAAKKPIVCFYVLIFGILCFGQDLQETCSELLKGCYCTDRYIDCTGADFSDISEIYPYITSKTYRIHITGEEFAQYQTMLLHQLKQADH